MVESTDDETVVAPDESVEAVVLMMQAVGDCVTARTAAEDTNDEAEALRECWIERGGAFLLSDGGGAFVEMVADEGTFRFLGFFSSTLPLLASCRVIFFLFLDCDRRSDERGFTSAVGVVFGAKGGDDMMRMK
jgi:hypothetical protein